MKHLELKFLQSLYDSPNIRISKEKVKKEIIGEKNYERIKEILTQRGVLKTKDDDWSINGEEGLEYFDKLKLSWIQENQIEILKEQSRHNRYLLFATFVIASGVIITLLNELIDSAVKYKQVNLIIFWNVLLWLVLSIVIIIYGKIFIELFWKRKNKKNDKRT